MLLAFFQTLEFPDSFNQSIAINIYAETICDGQIPLEVARGEAIQAAMEVFNLYWVEFPAPWGDKTGGR